MRTLVKIIGSFFLIFNVYNISFAVNIEAIVEDFIITDIDLKARFDLMNKLNPSGEQSVSFTLVKPKLLRALIDERLVLEEAKKEEIDITEENRLNVMIGFAEQNNKTLDQLISFIKDRGVKKEQLEELLVTQFVLAKLIQEKIHKSIFISSDELQHRLSMINYLHGFKKSGQVILEQIIVPVSNVATRTHSFFEAVNLGQPLKEIEKDFSHDSASTFTKIGWIDLDEMDIKFSEAISNMEIGSTEAILSGENFHVFKLVSVKNMKVEKSIDFSTLSPSQIEEIRVDISKSRSSSMAQKYLSDLRKSAYIRTSVNIN